MPQRNRGNAKEEAGTTMRRGRGWAEEGFSLVEILVGIAIFALLAGSIFFAASTYGRSLSQSASVQAATTTASTLVDSVERDARSALAIFTPNADVANHPNSDGHEVAFYARDARGSGGSFQSYCFKASASACGSAQAVGAVGIYRYAWGALPQNGGAGATYAGTIGEHITSFAAKTVPASALLDPAQNPTTAVYFSKIGVTSATDVARNTGFPGVLAGNRVTFVTFSASVATRALHLLAGAQPTHRNVVVATYTPPPNPLTVSGGNATLTFAYPLAPAQSITFTENNYGTRATTPAQVYNVIGTRCGTNATYAPGTITPASDGSGRGTLNVQPVVNPQPAPVNCTLTVADNSAQSQNVTVNIGRTYTPTASPPAAGRPGQNGVFTVAEQNYPSVPFSIALSGVCNAPTMLSGTQSGGSYVEQVQVTFSAAGVCTIKGTDGYGQTTSSSVSVYNDPVYTLSIPSGPSPSTLAIGGTSTFTATASQTQTSVPSGTPSTVPVSITGSSGPCTTAQVDPTTFSFTALAAGSCSMTIAANVGGVSNATTQNSPATVNISVSAAATPTPMPTPIATPVPTPTPAPTPTPVGTSVPTPVPTPTPTATPPLLICTQYCGTPPPASALAYQTTCNPPLAIFEPDGSTNNTQDCIDSYTFAIFSMSVPVAPNGSATAIAYPTQYMDHCNQVGSPKTPCSGWSIGQLQMYGDWADPSQSTSGPGNLLAGYSPFYYDANPGDGFLSTRGWGPGVAAGTIYLSLGISSGGYAFHMPGAQKGDGSVDSGVYTADVPSDYVFSQLGTPLPLTYMGTRSTSYSYQLCWPGGTVWCAPGNQPASVRRSVR